MIPLSKEKASLLSMGGVFVPSPLALTPEKTMDESYQRLLTLYYIRSGARSVVPAAHTGEFALNDLGLYERWLKIVMEMTRQYGRDMVNIAAVSGKEAVKQAGIAAAAGYDLVLLAPTAFSGRSPEKVVALVREIASVIPVLAFELQRAIPGSYPFTPALWRELFTIVYGAKGASFDTYRSLVMLEAAAQAANREHLILLTGNDDRIVSDLAGEYSFFKEGEKKSVRYAGGLLGHFATDTHAVNRWVKALMDNRAGDGWDFPLSREELAHAVNHCNMVLFDALGNFENSVWGVKYRLSRLGLLPAPVCFSETGRPGQAEAIDAVYGSYPDLCDEAFLREEMSYLKKETGIKEKTGGA